jgi:hypothetical protein
MLARQARESPPSPAADEGATSTRTTCSPAHQQRPSAPGSVRRSRRNRVARVAPPIAATLVPARRLALSVPDGPSLPWAGPTGGRSTCGCTPSPPAARSQTLEARTSGRRGRGSNDREGAADSRWHRALLDELCAFGRETASAGERAAAEWLLERLADEGVGGARMLAGSFSVRRSRTRAPTTTAPGVVAVIALARALAQRPTRSIRVLIVSTSEEGLCEGMRVFANRHFDEPRVRHVLPRG